MPSAQDPKELRLVLNPARRKALTSLIANILSHMRTKVEQSFDSNPQTETCSLFAENSYSRDPSPASTPSDSEKRLEARLEKNLSNTGLQELKKNSLFYFDAWAAEVRGQYKSKSDSQIPTEHCKVNHCYRCPWYFEEIDAKLLN